MTHHENTGPESLGSYSLDDEDQLQPEDTLDDRGLDDLLDEGYSPPERPRGVDAFGTTLAEQRRRESIEQRLAHEVPDPANAFEDPLADPDKVGGDDPDAIAAEDDFLGDGEVGGRRSGRLMAPDQGVREDAESDMVADDVGIDGGGSSAEEAAVHIIEDLRWDRD
ncbi:MAG TPA: DUF5709 domain-containing protein [Dermatophilaceae bacterium]|nr:DUF5709 domain-containing protein [Dermatophilaceae bacterium]